MSSSTVLSSSNRSTVLLPPPPTAEDEVLANMGSTQNLAFVYVLLAMEVIYMFVKASCSLFFLHGLARFIINIDELRILQNIVLIKFVACFLVIPLAVMCDSYLGRYKYYLVVASLCSFICLPCFFFVMSAPAYMLPARQKLFIYDICLLQYGINFLFEPLRIILVVKAILTRYQFQSKRTFFVLLVLAWNFATFAAALCIFLVRSSRIWYSALMAVNIAFMGIYLSFMLIFKQIFFLKRKTNYCCIEKTFANSFCYLLKKIDKLCCKQSTFNTPGWRDFRLFRFSERTALNSRAFVGILMVMAPLSCYFIMEVLIEYYYHIQFPMLKYDTEQFPTGGIIAAFYCIISAAFEYFILPQLKKFIKNESALLLTLVGVGMCLYVFTVFWCAVIQYKVINEVDFLSYGSETGHLVLINAVSAPVKIRGKYYNEFMSWKMNDWFSLVPWKPLKILFIPRREIPFHVTVSCPTFSMYDDYELPLEEDQYNWYLIFPHGVVQLPVGTFYYKAEVAIKPELYPPATVNVLCRIPLCAGFLIFKKNEQQSIQTAIRSSHNMVTLEVVGTFQISFALVGNKSTTDVIDATFERLGVYLLIIHIVDAENISLNWAPGFIYPNTDIKTTVTVVQNSIPRNHSHAYVYPSLVMHAAGESLARVSFLCWLYFVTPVDLRVLCFSIPMFLSLPSYAYLFVLSPTRFQVVIPIIMFSFGCVCCLFIVMFFFAAIYHNTRCMTGKSVSHPNSQQASFLIREVQEPHLSMRSKEA